MKYYELKQITQFLSQFKKIFAIERVDDTTIKILFDRFKPIFVDLKKGNSSFFMSDELLKQKHFQAPFDVQLNKLFTRSNIEKITLLPNNRIVQIAVTTNSHYKSQNAILQLEFTGKNTNAIILNEDFIVLEALRHINEKSSFRVVEVGERLLELPPFCFKEEEKNIENIEKFLYEIYQKNIANQLALLKHSRALMIEKKREKLINEYENLPEFDELMNESERLNFHGGLVLANLEKIKSYSKEVELKDFHDKMQKIIFPKEAKTPQHAANLLYERSKKLRQKANGVHIEKNNLLEKIEFFNRLLELIKDAKSVGEINILAPKQISKRKKKEKKTAYEVFFVEDFKILVGKSQKSNIELFKDAKSKDIWLHIKDIPSSHIIIKTQKTNVPNHILEFGAKLCVNFSTSQKGSFLVDYTKWQNVKIQSGSNVFYTNYKSLKVVKD